MSGSGVATLLFYLFAVLACVGAVGVLILDRIVYMAVALLVSLGAVAGLFFIAGADFVGLVQLMVYVGGTVVLLAFGVMLTARRNPPAWQVPMGQWMVGLAAGTCLLAVLLWASLGVPQWRMASPIVLGGASPESEGPASTVRPLGWGMLGVRIDPPDPSQKESGPSQREPDLSQKEPGLSHKEPDLSQNPPVPAQKEPALSVEEPAPSLEEPVRSGLSGYLLPFEIISVHLVLVLVGAAFLARARRPRRNAPSACPPHGLSGQP